jgi:cytidylate kinase
MPTGIHRIIDQQMRKWELEAQARRESPRELPAEVPVIHPCVTIARQIGSGGGAVARGIASALGRPLCDREILETVASEGRIRAQILELLDERDRSALQIWIEGILRGRLADKEDYLRALVHAVGSVAAHGPTVFIGRGVNFILGPQRGLHLRIMAPVEWRLETLRLRRGIAEAEARALLERTDADRAAFIRRHFHREIDDPLAYDLVLNSASLSIARCVQTALAAWGGVTAGAANTADSVASR